MWTLINAPETRIFGIAIGLMLLLGLMELLSLLLGGDGGGLDGLLPESLTEAGHTEIGLDAAADGVWVRLLSWLYVGKVPLLMLMVVFWGTYGLCGYLLQGAAAALSGSYLNTIPAAVAAWFLSLPLVRAAAAVLHKILPKDETSAVSQDELLGRIGVVVTGTARENCPAEVRVKDRYGQQHYVMAEAEAGTELPQGSMVLLVSRHGSSFKAIANPSGSLVD